MLVSTVNHPSGKSLKQAAPLLSVRSTSCFSSSNAVAVTVAPGRGRFTGILHSDAQRDRNVIPPRPRVEPSNRVKLKDTA